MIPAEESSALHGVGSGKYPREAAGPSLHCSPAWKKILWASETAKATHSGQGVRGLNRKPLTTPGICEETGTTQQIWNSVISLLRISPTEIIRNPDKDFLGKNIHRSIIIMKNRKPFRCLQMGNWLNKFWYNQTMKYYIVIKVVFLKTS